LQDFAGHDRYPVEVFQLGVRKADASCVLMILSLFFDRCHNCEAGGAELASFNDLWIYDRQRSAGVNYSVNAKRGRKFQPYGRSFFDVRRWCTDLDEYAWAIFLKNGRSKRKLMGGHSNSINHKDGLFLADLLNQELGSGSKSCDSGPQSSRIVIKESDDFVVVHDDVFPFVFSRPLFAATLEHSKICFEAAVFVPHDQLSILV
jgi:hypothetical protein